MGIRITLRCKPPTIRYEYVAIVERDSMAIIGWFRAASLKRVYLGNTQPRPGLHPEYLLHSSAASGKVKPCLRSSNVWRIVSPQATDRDKRTATVSGSNENIWLEISIEERYEQDNHG